MKLERNDRQSYEIKNGEITVGYLWSERHPGSGRGYSQYVGYIAPYTEWYVEIEEPYSGSRFSSFKEAKAYVKSLS